LVLLPSALLSLKRLVELLPQMVIIKYTHLHPLELLLSALLVLEMVKLITLLLQVVAVLAFLTQGEVALVAGYIYRTTQGLVTQQTTPLRLAQVVQHEQIRQVMDMAQVAQTLLLQV
tara:strand:- start:235 stop:585 length:351 start_codon:yes stop_codon:yes gene_type:complete